MLHDSFEPAVRLRSVRFWLLLGVVAHCAIGLARLPTVAIGRRLAEADAFRREGDATWLFGRAFLHGAQVVAQVRQRSSPDAVVAVRGMFKGAVEFLPRLVWPRLCCREEALPLAAESYLGRPIAPFVVVADNSTLRLEER